MNILYEKSLIRKHENYRVLASFQGIKVPSLDVSSSKKNLSDEDKKAQAMLMEQKLTKMFGNIPVISNSELPDG